MSSTGFPILVVATLIAGTAGALVMLPKDMLRSTVVKAPVPAHVVEVAATPGTPLQPAPRAAVQLASLTVSVTPLPQPETRPEPTPAVIATPEPVAPGVMRDIRRTTAGVLNMRAEPHQHSELVASLPRGTEVSVTETSGSWALVTTEDGTTGWMSVNFMTPVE